MDVLISMVSLATHTVFTDVWRITDFLSGETRLTSIYPPSCGSPFFLSECRHAGDYKGQEACFLVKSSNPRPWLTNLPKKTPPRLHKHIVCMYAPCPQQCANRDIDCRLRRGLGWQRVVRVAASMQASNTLRRCANDRVRFCKNQKRPFRLRLPARAAKSPSGR